MRKWRKSVFGVAAWAAVVLAGYMGYTYAQDRRFVMAENQREQIREGLANAAQLGNVFRQVGKVVEPAVVNINVVKKAPTGPQRLPFDEDTMRRFFPDRDGDGEPDMPPGLDEQLAPEQIGTGSGVIMDAAEGKGWIVTNNHVAGGAEELTITLHDGRKIRSARVVGTDPKTDLAVVEIQADRLPTARWGNSEELQKGDWILAFGSPFNFVGSMTHGIVSALNRQADILGAGGYENFIQVDAPINPGNSGGPLVNLRGEVVGINTAIATRSGGFQGIGFAIPSNQAKFVYEQLRQKGKVVRGWLGVAIESVSEDPGLARSFGYEGDTGVIVQDVIEGTPATGKLRRGDVITEVNGKPVENVYRLRTRIAALAPNEEARLRVFRDAKYSNIIVKLGEQPEELSAVRQPGMPPAPRNVQPDTGEALGIHYQTLTPQLAQRQGLDVNQGAVITRIDRNSVAGREARLMPGDVVVEVGRTRIASAQDLTAALKGADLKKGVRMYVVNPRGSRYVFLQSDR